MCRIEKLKRLWAELNVAHFDGLLHPVPIRVTRSKRTYGYYNGPNNGGQPSIRISHVLAVAEPDTLRNTMAHEMIHQQLHEWNVPEWDGHGPAFQREHVRVFGHPYVEPS